MEIEGPRLVLRDAVPPDEPALRRILAAPEVARWWGEVDDLDGMLAVTLDGQVIGAIQYDEEEDPQYRSASIDIFLDPAHHGRGYGTEAVRTLAGWLIEVRGHRRLTIDPAAHNTAAIRAYEKVGFKRVGVMRAYERDPETGVFHDGLLMDLLAEELI
ncbi:GNAT family N-acetyltransferase [Nonomuraea africana]|uniref:Aminoglycoside 6'-N-acetyltransferase n=1 Tax=Nonomuraea africana TaxID=46171 RepID=A0ABR9KWI7_9ACTN|nr:GNAT family protein [Nonomuraea africana]MBE1566409.1 aminoglycoside 6'-N-acetyltransferase [Nonomuraea africana]